MYREVRQTRFSVEPLKSIVGTGNVTAYQIVVSPGEAIGRFGEVTVPAQAEICNDPDFNRNSADESGGSLLATWFRRALATLKF